MSKHYKENNALLVSVHPQILKQLFRGKQKYINAYGGCDITKLKPPFTVLCYCPKDRDIALAYNDVLQKFNTFDNKCITDIMQNLQYKADIVNGKVVGTFTCVGVDEDNRLEVGNGTRRIHIYDLSSINKMSNKGIVSATVPKPWQYVASPFTTVELDETVEINLEYGCKECVEDVSENETITDTESTNTTKPSRKQKDGLELILNKLKKFFNISK